MRSNDAEMGRGSTLQSSKPSQTSILGASSPRTWRVDARQCAVWQAVDGVRGGVGDFEHEVVADDSVEYRFQRTGTERFDVKT